MLRLCAPRSCRTRRRPRRTSRALLAPPRALIRHTIRWSTLRATRSPSLIYYTLNYFFGVGKIAGDTGFFLNNEMDDFTSKPGVRNSLGLVQGAANAIGPGKRPLSSMSPTILLDPDGKVFMVTGTPGGATIITTVLQTIIDVIDYGMNIQQAVDAPRFHHQWLPDVVTVEHGYMTPEVQAKLEAMGYTFRQMAIGADEAIMARDGVLQGANDRRDQVPSALTPRAHGLQGFRTSRSWRSCGLATTRP
jgi:gamma-glutamyltranspeptidase / glutathione hydrolase